MSHPPLPAPYSNIYPMADCRHEVCLSPAGPGNHQPVFTAEQMRAYADAAVAEVTKEANAWVKQLWAIANALNCLPSSYVDGNDHVLKQAERYAAVATREPVPEFTPVAARKLKELQAGGYRITGYSFESNGTPKRGLITSSGMVGWWMPHVGAVAVPDDSLTVWFGAMPESNGKSNWTCQLYRKSDGLFEGDGITIMRSEFKDQVRYEADRLRYLLGEISERPDILAYDPKLQEKAS